MASSVQRREGKDVQLQMKEDVRADKIREQVLGMLGQPDHLWRVQVCQLWQSYYRVNILIGLDAASAKVANSYFLEVDAEGTIVSSAPKIMHARKQTNT